MDDAGVDIARRKSNRDVGKVMVRVFEMKTEMKEKYQRLRVMCFVLPFSSNAHEARSVRW